MSKRKFFTATAWLTGIIAFILAIIAIAIKVTEMGKAEELNQNQATEATQTAAEETEPQEATDETVPFDPKAEAQAMHEKILSDVAEAPEEEKVFFESGQAVGQLDENDPDVDTAKILEQFEMPASEEARHDAREAYKALLNDCPEAYKVEIYPIWDSYPLNLDTGSAEDPVTGNTLTYERTHSGWIHGYVNNTISWATARIFGSKGDDEESFRERMVYTIKNYPAFVEILELHGEATVLGKKIKEVFPFFEAGVEIADRNQAEGVGIYGVLENVGTKENPKYKYSEEWENIMADYYLWLDHVSYDGTFEWWTRERGYLGPADGTASSGVEHAFDYSSIADIRANFTTDKQRQTNLPSEIFCLRDKQNGYRVSDFMGINMVTSDAELYGEAPKVEKKAREELKDGGAVEVINYTLKQQPSGSNKVTYTATTGEVKPVPTHKPTPTSRPTPTPTKKPTPTPTSRPTPTPTKKPTPTPTPTPKPTTPPKNPNEDPSREHPENVEPESGPNDDPGPGVYEEGVPDPPASPNPAEDQGGNQSEYTQEIESGEITPPGQENPDTPPPGTVEENVPIPDETGEEHTGTEVWHEDPNTGADVADGYYEEETPDGGTQDVFVDHVEVETEPAEDVDESNHEEAGDETQNTGDEDYGFGF